MAGDLIGLKDSGCDLELEIVHETGRAYKLRDWFGTEFWMPKVAFDEEGTLKDGYHDMLVRKQEEEP